MKNILAIIILLSFLSCSNQKKAEEIIRKNIESQTVNGYTYNALIFSKLSDALSNIKDDVNCQKCLNTFFIFGQYAPKLSLNFSSSL